MEKKKEDAIRHDVINKEKADFLLTIKAENFPKSYYTSYSNWDCENSSVGKCVYDFNNPMGDDDCVFCHEPDERK